MSTRLALGFSEKDISSLQRHKVQHNLGLCYFSDLTSYHFLLGWLHSGHSVFFAIPGICLVHSYLRAFAVAVPLPGTLFPDVSMVKSLPSSQRPLFQYHPLTDTILDHENGTIPLHS